MKKHLLLSVLIVLVYLAGCQTVNEEEMAPQSVGTAKEIPTQQAVQVKDWFEQHEAELNRQSKKGNANAREENSDAFFAPFIEKLPDWGGHAQLSVS
ncbi:hypothetical protein [Echinicola rosea]|uniref:Uncharacterized protein n=1 Tax=Echinicola rosea TaxID=1807691 RepID=A0ABQ1V0B8_9BACT|nr:hypothetical protein [Echinicola rosea]GGF31458.1 hypothetical protein GCM10011339_19570 [Echinicola rosea]